MAPYDFDAPDSDVILRSSDGKEFHVHQFILSLTSPVFQGMFGLPQPTKLPSEIPIIDIPESSGILQPFIQYLYPRSPPKIPDIATWAALYAIADKYGAEAVMDPLRDMLIPQFLEASPLRVYALASRWGFVEEAKIASRRTLMIDIFKEFPREDAELMGGDACQQLYLLHFNRREAARALVTGHPPPSSRAPPPGHGHCKCPPPSLLGPIQALSQHVASIPWLTAEEVYEAAGNWGYPNKCSEHCRNAYMNIQVYFASLLKGVSELPQTI